ncbi:transcription factor bHLH18-like [Neltuma alba]|uniref:transcription factor bHLH18-like n=1 Tax=Neltuma alba TaxID=207710 RepID=UPI0010A40582|nr:transcription factor bHLH18-like [Prosopis alba]
MDQLSWEAFLSELDMENEFDIRGTNSDQDDEGQCFLRDILQDPNNLLSSDSETILPPTPVPDGGATTGNSANSSFVVNSQQSASETTPRTACVLSFDQSVVIPDIPDPSYNHSLQRKDVSSYSLEPKRTVEMLDYEPAMNRGKKKARSGAGAMDHILAERRRRQELTEKFIALSATIPGLKKIDKASILSEAISYVKRLQERVKELEKEANKITSADDDNDDIDRAGTPASSEVNSGDRYTPNNDVLPDVKARMSDDKQALIRILCKKQDCAMLRMLDELKNLNLSVIPFGSSTLDVTIIAQYA